MKDNWWIWKTWKNKKQLQNNHISRGK